MALDNPVIIGSLTGTPDNPVFMGSLSGAGTGSGDGVPSGVICGWSGLEVNIPTGWYLCDGNNSTPDLRGYFIVGAAGDSDNGETGSF
jgi:hypothetical protein